MILKFTKRAGFIYNACMPSMLEEKYIYEGARFVSLVQMDVLCHVVFEHSNAFGMSNVAHPEKVVVSENETFTIDSILENDIECNFDNHDELCERFVPEHVRKQSGTLVFSTCRFFSKLDHIRKRCEFIGQDKYADEDGIKIPT